MAKPYQTMDKHTFQMWSPQLRNWRTIDIYLPESYALGRLRYPVVYLQDGQNLSDPFTAFAGKTWQLEGALARLRQRGIEPIVVGIHHAGTARLAEYSPFADPRHGGGLGVRYCRFVLDTLGPRIDAQYRTSRHRSGRAIAGSSMGGLISLYAFFLRGSPFGRVAALSPSIWFGARGLLEYVEHAGTPRGRIYIDAGSAEGQDTMRNTRALARVLRRKGYGSPGTLCYVEAHGHGHSETDWAKRLPDALAFLLDRTASRP
jgi:predicted alpha/beta superfamily hydrolase